MPKLKPKKTKIKNTKKKTAPAKAKKKPVAKAKPQPKAKAKAKSATKAKAKSKPVAAKKAAASKPKKKPAVKTAKTAPPPRKFAPIAAVEATKPKAGFKKQITKLLNEQKRKILFEVSNKVKSESDGSKYEIGDIYDIATTERDRELSLILGDMERETLAEIEDALDRISTGEYGECEDCGEPIGEKRLMALPFTRTCVECKSRSEREETLRAKFEEEPGIAMVDRSPIEEEEV